MAVEAKAKSLAKRGRLLAIGIGAAAFVIVVAAAILLAIFGHAHSTVVVEQPGGPTVRETGGFDMGLFALILDPGLGITALAAATGLLAVSTWRDVRASTEIAREARETNRLARVEQDRRPELTLLPDDGHLSQVEGDGWPYVWMLAQQRVREARRRWYPSRPRDALPLVAERRLHARLAVALLDKCCRRDRRIGHRLRRHRPPVRSRLPRAVL